MKSTTSTSLIALMAVSYVSAAAFPGNSPQPKHVGAHVGSAHAHSEHEKQSHAQIMNGNKNVHGHNHGPPSNSKASTLERRYKPHWYWPNHWWIMMGQPHVFGKRDTETDTSSTNIEKTTAPSSTAADTSAQTETETQDAFQLDISVINNCLRYGVGCEVAGAQLIAAAQRGSNKA